MKIAQIVCVLPPINGGIGTVAHNYSEYLTQQGHEVTVFLPKYKVADLPKKKYQVKLLRPIFRIGYAAFLPQILWQLKDFRVVHLHYPFFGTSFLVALYKKIKKNKIKFIVSYHMDVKASGSKGLFVKFYNKFFRNFILNTADNIVVSSIDYIANSEIEKFYKNNSDKFFELPFGVPDDFSNQPKDEKLLAEYDFKNDDKIIVFVGGLDSAHYFKGVDYLIEAIDKIKQKNIKAIIVGQGNLKADFEKKVIDLNLADQIKFAGRVANQDLVKYYNLGDVFTLPSIDSSEAFGIVLIEAMACGCPIIASDLKGVRQVVSKGLNGLLIEPKNSLDLAEKLDLILNNNNLCGNFSANAEKSVSKYYKWPKITEKLVKLYKKSS